MEAALSDDDEDEEAIPKQGNKVGKKEGKRDPYMLLFQARDAQKNEEWVAGARGVKSCHAQFRSPVLWCGRFGGHFFFLPRKLDGLEWGKTNHILLNSQQKRIKISLHLFITYVISVGLSSP